MILPHRSRAARVPGVAGNTGVSIGTLLFAGSSAAGWQEPRVGVRGIPSERERGRLSFGQPAIAWTAAPWSGRRDGNLDRARFPELAENGVGGHARQEGGKGRCRAVGTPDVTRRGRPESRCWRDSAGMISVAALDLRIFVRITLPAARRTALWGARTCFAVVGRPNSESSSRDRAPMCLTCAWRRSSSEQAPHPRIGGESHRRRAQRPVPYPSSVLPRRRNSARLGD